MRRITDAPADGGFAIVEVLISGVIAVTAAAGVMALMATSVRTAGKQRLRSQSYAIAQEDQARLRATRIPLLRNLSESRTVTLGGTKFTVKSTGKFVNDVSESVSCGTDKSSEDYVKIGSEVTWPNMGSTPATTIHSIISPPSNSLNPKTGTLVFSARSSRNVAVTPSLSLLGSGAGTFSGSTDSSGCAVFLEQASGEYTLKVSSGPTGVVDVDGVALPSERKITVNPQTTTSIDLLYDKPGSVPINFKTTNYANQSESANATNLIAYNSGMTTAKMYSFTSATSYTATSLFPFESADSFYVGSCTENAPTSGTIGIVSVAVPVNGTATAQNLTMPALLLNVKTNGTSTSANGAKVRVTSEECGGSTREYTTETVSSTEGRLKSPELPWGTYSVCAYYGFSETVNGRTRTVYREASLEPFEVKSAKTEKTLNIKSGSTGSPEGRC